MNKSTRLEDLLGKVFDSAREGLSEELPSEEYDRRRQDFIFHMTDWKDDLGQLSHLMNNPENMDEDTASRFLIGFLYHVVPHLNAAGRLLLDEIKDPFGGSLNSSHEAIPPSIVHPSQT